MIYSLHATITHVSGSTNFVQIGVIEPSERVIKSVAIIQWTGDFTSIGVRLKDHDAPIIPHPNGPSKFLANNSTPIMDEHVLTGSPYRIVVEGFNSHATNDAIVDIVVVCVNQTLLQTLYALVELVRGVIPWLREREESH